MKKISRKTAKALEKIAMSASYSLEYRGGIDERNNDSEDFPETVSYTHLTLPTICSV